MPRKTTSPRHSDVLGRALLRAAAVLDIEPSRLAQVLGVSERSITRLARGAYTLKSTSKSWELAALLIRLYQGLDAMTGSDEAAMRSWMWSPNTDLLATPAEDIVTVHGLVRIVQYIEAFRAQV